ncbi:hypothetical protein AMTRI_Chr08g210500 [Amborella trichopoda]|uniref:DUF7866 domain-containing protein n=1 Tax=Amborella trichopoda TaxID=13333 RepID=W1P9F5_AMBTC|nr:hypothetical protein AMTR_s00077p00185660 [Amborella trichopoda]
MASPPALHLVLFLLLLSTTNPTRSEPTEPSSSHPTRLGPSQNTTNSGLIEYMPSPSGVEHRTISVGEAAPFGVCETCQCCPSGPGADPSLCTNKPCCFHIVCNLPNKPFGTCTFTPSSCNCTGCGSGT